METKKSIGFGLRGWLLIIFQFIGFVAFTAFTNYPMNLLAGSGFYGGISGYDANMQAIGTSTVATIYTLASVVAIIIQLIIAKQIGKMKSVKTFSMILGAIGLIGAAFITFYPPTMKPEGDLLWLIVYGIECVVIIMYATFSIGILVGQWFPRRKGTVMGIATLAFPICNGLLGLVANTVFAAETADGMPYLIQFCLGMGGKNTVQSALLPFLIVCVIGWLIGLFFVKDYPEQVGAFRDNDRSITPEIADAMMKQEIEAKRTTVWGPGNTFKSRDFWFITIPAGLLLMFSVGAMTQTQSIFKMVGLGDSYSKIMAGVMVAGIVGSYVLGIIDTKIGTKKSMIIAMVLMIISGLLGVVGSSMTKTVAVDNQVIMSVEEHDEMMASAGQSGEGESAGEAADSEGESAGAEAAAAEGESAGEAAGPEGESAGAEAAVIAEVSGDAAAVGAAGGTSKTGQVLIIIAFIILALFMGASSNYTVSAAAQYWRREDFGSVFASVNSVANLINAIGPMVVAMLLFSAIGLTGVMIACAAAGVVSLILMLCFSAKHVKATDDKYREKAGKPLDDALVGRK